ncbi:MAG: NAD-dependent epimerase/dehydratase family protein [Halobacteria archaeon]
MAPVYRMEGRRALLLGGLGFIGSNLAHRLVGLGARVTLYDACLDPCGWNFRNLEGIRGRVRFVKGDARDRSRVERAVKGQEFVFNLFAQMGHGISMKEPLLDLDINARGNLTVLEACRRVNDDAVVVYAGTRAQMGEPRRVPVTEAHPQEPAEIYGIHKLAAEKYHLLYHKVHGMRTTSLRIGNTYGPRHQMRHAHWGVLNWFIRRAMLGEPIELHGDGRQARDFLYVDDVVEALVRLARCERARGEAFLIGSRDAVPLRTVAEKVVRAVGRGSLRRVPYPPGRKEIEIRRFAASTAKLKRCTGWVQSTGLDEGIGRTVEFYRENLRYYL